MIFKIYYNGDYQDYVIIEGESMEDIRRKAKEECVYRGWDEKDCWSENLAERWD